jgi:hypothetical protein
MIQQKQIRNKTMNSKLGFSKDDASIIAAKQLNNLDKMRIIENFVENDDVLGQLLDFISHKNGTVPHENSSSNMPDPKISMTMVDKQGNKIVQFNQST